MIKILLALALLGVAGCGLQVGPFPPPAGAKVCSSDVQCRDHERCWFPRINSRAVCMPGHNESMPALP